MASHKPATGLEHFVSRVQADPFFLGHLLVACAASRDMTLSRLGDFLRCDGKQMRRLMMCRAPDPADPRFKADIVRIASFVGCDADRLLTVIREIEVLEALRKSTSAAELSQMTGLLAARDKRKKASRSKRPGKSGHVRGE